MPKPGAAYRTPEEEKPYVITIERGFFLNVTLFGQGIVVPPFDIDISFKFLADFIEDITSGVTQAISSVITSAVDGLLTPIQAIPQLVWNLFEDTLDKMAADYYERHSEEEE